MIINQNKKGRLLLRPDASLRSSCQKSPDLTATAESASSKVRFFTERDDTEHTFCEYEQGKKILGDLPEIKLRKLRHKPSLFNHIFNFISSGKRKNPSPDKPKEQAIAHRASFECQKEFNSSNGQNRSVHTQFLKRKHSENTQIEGSNCGYSLIMPDRYNKSEERPDFYRIIKRRTNKGKQEKQAKRKKEKVKTESNEDDPAISNLIKVGKISLSQMKEGKSIINRTKLFNLQRRDYNLNRVINSRIQPWSFNFNPIDTDSF